MKIVFEGIKIATMLFLIGLLSYVLGNAARLEQDYMSKYEAMYNNLVMEHEQQMIIGECIAIPYIVTLDKSSGEVLAIRRNWEPDDTTHQKRQHFVHYGYIPGFGFYCFGLVHWLEPSPNLVPH